MKSVWREYGVISTLLVVAVGGYLYMSRSESDLLAQSLDRIGGHLLSMVPDGSGHPGLQAALDTLDTRVKEGHVKPEKLERYAASVFNLGTTGAPIEPEDAELLVRLAYSEQDALPTPEAVSAPAPAEPVDPTSEQDLAELAVELPRMVTFYETVRSDAWADTTGPGVRFFSDGKLHVVVDDRLREKFEAGVVAQDLLDERAMVWQAQLSEAAAAERERQMKVAEKVARYSWKWADTSETKDLKNTLVHLRTLHAMGVVSGDQVDAVLADQGPDSLRIPAIARAVARYRKLKAMGMVSEAEVDAFLESIEGELETVIRIVPPPPPPPDVRIDSGSGSRVGGDGGPSTVSSGTGTSTG